MEIWKDIKGYEGLYQVSSLGRVKSLKNGEYKIMKTAKDACGYPHLTLLNKSHRVHRLVAEAFIPNPDNKPCVDHINTIRDDNRVENLRWCSHRENCNNQTSKTNYQKAHHTPVIQLSLKGEPLKYFDSMTIEGFNSCNISLVCGGKSAYHKGYRWLKFEDFCDLY